MNTQHRARVQPPRSTADVFEADLQKIEYVQALGAEVVRSYGFCRVDTPTFEHLNIFELTAPFSRDKCYVFSDKSGRELVLRPDIMAPISRLVANNCLAGVFPAKFFFYGKVFRYRHAKRREFRLFGLEAYGSKGYDADAEIIRITMDIFRKIGIDQAVVEFSYPAIYAILVEDIARVYSLPLDSSDILHQLQLCKSQEDVSLILLENAFPKEMRDFFLRMLFCNDDVCGWQFIEELAVRTDKFSKIATELMDFSVALDAYHLRSNSIFNISNLHGLGYYSGLTYRINAVKDNQQLADGGRYDTFIQSLCGKSVNASGIAFGVERLIRIAESQDISIARNMPKVLRVLVSSSTRLIMNRLRSMLSKLRQRGYVIEEYFQSGKFSQTIKYAQSRKYDLLLSFDQSQNNDGRINVHMLSLDKNQRKDYVIDDADAAVGSFFNEIL